MTPADLVRAFYDDIWNAGRLSRIADVIAEDFDFRGSLGTQIRGHDGFARYVQDVRAALSDYHCEIRDLVEQPPRAAAWMRFSGLHDGGTLLGFAATGRTVTWDGAAFFRCQATAIQALWVLGDLESLRRQLAA